MYEEFTELKDSHELEMNKLTKKYKELETLFEERPSRVEDLSKIKALIEEKEKMGQEIQKCQKKITSANEVVKYLNLELENYKDVYDIFGPGEETKSGSKPESTQEAINSFKKVTKIKTEESIEVDSEEK